MCFHRVVEALRRGGFDGSGIHVRNMADASPMLERVGGTAEILQSSSNKTVCGVGDEREATDGLLRCAFAVVTGIGSFCPYCFFNNPLVEQCV